MRACRWIVATALLTLATALAPPVMAESERIYIQLESPKGCSDQAAFLRALRKRTKRFEPVNDPHAARRFVVTIHRTASSVLGQLEIRGEGTAPSVRNVAGKTCDEVAAALALMAALAIDPTAQNPQGQPPPPTDAAADSARVAGAPGAPEAPNTRTSPSGTTRIPDTVMPRVSPPPPRPSAPERQAPGQAASVVSAEASGSLGAQPLRFAAGFHLNASDRVSPGRAWGGVLFVEAAFRRGSANPVIRGGLFFSRASVVLPSGAGADFQWYLGLLEGCPATLATANGRFAIYPCLAANVGVLRGQGRNLDENEATADMWADLGPVVRARAGLLLGFSLEAAATLVFPLRRLSFEVEDRGPGNAATTVFAAPSWGVRAGVGVAYDFQ